VNLKAQILTVAAALSVAGALSASTASAAVIPIVNASFETLPSGGLPNLCGAGCSYSIATIPGWLGVGVSGQFQPGTAGYLNSVPDGITVAYTNQEDLTQTVGATAVAGLTYTLTGYIGYRHDIAEFGSIVLEVGSNQITATGVPPAQGSGDWGFFTAIYTATAADAGAPITIDLVRGAGTQADFDNLSLTSSAGGAVPEPASWAMMVTGFGALGAILRRRRRALPA
jgi:hypothetical protein